MNTATYTVYSKRYPIKFGNGAIRRFCDMHEPPIETVTGFYEYFAGLKIQHLTPGKLGDLALLIFCAIDSGCNLTGKTHDLNVDIIYEYLGDDLDALSRAVGLFNAATPREPEKKTKGKTPAKTARK